MKTAVVLLIALLGLVTAIQRVRPANPASVKTQFDKFIAKYNKTYSGAAEYNLRLRYFEQNLKGLAVQRAVMARNDQTSWTVDITPLFDLSADEKTYYTGRQKMPAAGLATSCLAHGVTAPTLDTSATPTTWDWRTHGVVNPVKNQGQCGSCWAFSTIGVIESKFAIAGHTLTSFSEQEIVDCSVGCSEEPPYGKVCNQGCNGGWPWNAYEDIIGWKGLELESSYVYTAQTGTCERSKYGPPAAPISNGASSSPSVRCWSARSPPPSCPSPTRASSTGSAKAASISR